MTNSVHILHPANTAPADAAEDIAALIDKAVSDCAHSARALPGYEVGYGLATTNAHAIALAEFEAIRRGARPNATPLQTAFDICCAIFSQSRETK